MNNEGTQDSLEMNKYFLRQYLLPFYTIPEGETEEEVIESIYQFHQSGEYIFTKVGLSHLYRNAGNLFDQEQNQNFHDEQMNKMNFERGDPEKGEGIMIPYDLLKSNSREEYLVSSLPPHLKTYLKMKKSIPLREMYCNLSDKMNLCGYRHNNKEELDKIREIFAFESKNERDRVYSVSNVDRCFTELLSEDYKEDRPSILMLAFKKIDEELAVIDSIIQKGLITHDSLWYLFSKKKMDYMHVVNHTKQGCSIENIIYAFSQGNINNYMLQSNRRNTISNQRGFYALIKCVVLQEGEEDHMTREPRVVHIPFFEGLKKIKDLPLQPCVGVEKDELIKRGKKMLSYLCSQEPFLVDYQGKVIDKDFHTLKVDEQLIINPSYQYVQKFRGTSPVFLNQLRIERERVLLKENIAWLLPPMMVGYRHSKDVYVHFHIEKAKLVKPDDKPFKSLLLPDTHLKMLKSVLTTQSLRSSTSLLFVGRCGTGKKFTASAIAKRLGCPFFHINACTFSNHPEESCYILQSYVRLAENFQGILFVEKAEMFLESPKDLLTSKLVSTLSSILSKSTAFIILSTDKLSSVDHRIADKVTLSLPFKEFSFHHSLVFWKRMLKNVNVDYQSFQLEKWVRFSTVPREIQQHLHIALALARQENVPLSDYIFKKGLLQNTADALEPAKFLSWQFS